MTVFIIFYALTSFVAGYVRCGTTARLLPSDSKCLPPQRPPMKGVPGRLAYSPEKQELAGKVFLFRVHALFFFPSNSMWSD